uniref:Serine/threonine-protein kinase svkA n=1 Tax=Lygus hesperus TaxID=30085 RepID=A0A0A9Y238_LYGHE
MAPEVIAQNVYDWSADIWSLGITILEMTQGAPPYFYLHPLKALFTISRPDTPAPNLPDNNLSKDGRFKYSKDMRDFIGLCCQRKSNLRPSAHTLLKHRWFRSIRSKKIQDLLECMNERLFDKVAEEQVLNELV